MVPIPFTQRWLTRNRVTRRLLFATFLISITVFNFGFDTTAYSTIQAMDRKLTLFLFSLVTFSLLFLSSFLHRPCLFFIVSRQELNLVKAFIDRFGQCNAKGKCSISTTHLSFLNSFPRITFGVGIISGQIIGSRYGRRPVIVVYNVIALVGSIVSYTAKNYGQVLAGRMIVFLYIGMEGWLVPMFQAEIVPAHMRGAVVVSYVFNHVLGSFVMSAVTYVTSQWKTDTCWKVPMALGIPLPAIVLLLSWTIPESPRWLVRQNRDEEALQSLRSMFGSDPNFSPENEMALLKSSLAEEDSRESAAWIDLFRGTNLVRAVFPFPRFSFSPFSRHGTDWVSFLASHVHCHDHLVPQSGHRPKLCLAVRHHLRQVTQHDKSVPVYLDEQWHWLHRPAAYHSDNRSHRPSWFVSFLGRYMFSVHFHRRCPWPCHTDCLRQGRHCVSYNPLRPVLRCLVWPGVSNQYSIRPVPFIAERR